MSLVVRGAKDGAPPGSKCWSCPTFSIPSPPRASLGEPQEKTVNHGAAPRLVVTAGGEAAVKLCSILGFQGTAGSNFPAPPQHWLCLSAFNGP